MSCLKLGRKLEYQNIIRNDKLYKNGEDMKYTIYDTETTGLHFRFDYALTFSAKTVDDKFNIIDEINLTTKLRPGMIPSVYAIATNKLKISELNKSVLSFYEMTKKIHKYFKKHSPGYVIGHNSLKFDEEILRSHFYQCLLPVYITQSNGSVRADTLIMARAASAFSPNSIKINNNNKNKLDFTLEGIASANNFSHSKAHTAESDVIACIEILKKISSCDHSFFKSCLKTASKSGIEKFISENYAFCFFKSINKKLLLTNCIKLNSSYLGFDLTKDPDDFKQLSALDLIQVINKKNSPFHIIKNNKQSILLDLSYKKFTNCNLNDQEIFSKAKKIQSDLNFKNNLKIALELINNTSHNNETVEEKIFSEGFPNKIDQNLMDKFHKYDWDKRSKIINKFKDPRFKELSARLVYEHNPMLLDKKSVKLIEKKLHEKLYMDINRPRNIYQAKKELNDFLEKNPNANLAPIVELENYINSI